MIPFFFPGIDINTYTNFQRTSHPCNHLLHFALKWLLGLRVTSGCYMQWALARTACCRVFCKLVYVETWEKGRLRFCIRGLSKKNFTLYILRQTLESPLHIQLVFNFFFLIWESTCPSLHRFALTRSMRMLFHDEPKARFPKILIAISKSTHTKDS